MHFVMTIVKRKIKKIIDGEFTYLFPRSCRGFHENLQTQILKNQQLSRRYLKNLGLFKIVKLYSMHTKQRRSRKT